MNFEELSRKVKKLSKDTMTEVQKMNEVRQLNGKVSEEKKYLNKLYQELGKKLYDKYRDAETPLEGFEADFRKITERYSVMDLLQDEIRTVKGVVLCPCCNMEVSAEERFCSNCGNRMPEQVKIEDKIDEDAIVIDSTVVESEDTAAAKNSEEGACEDVTEATDAVDVVSENSEEGACEDVTEAADIASEESEEAVCEDVTEATEAADTVSENSEEAACENVTETTEAADTESESSEETASEDMQEDAETKADAAE